MAFDVWITGYSGDFKSDTINFELKWWNTDFLKKDKRFIHTWGGSYSDYVAELSVEEARELHEKFRLEAVSGVYGSDGWQEILQPVLNALDNAVSKGEESKSTHFRVTVAEWESGY
jgi:hypothetical protein